MRSLSCIFCFLCLLSSNLLPAHAQQPDPDPIKIGPTATPKIPADACLYATIHVKEIVTMPELKLLPWEIVTAAGMDNLGFDPLAIERLDLIGGILEDQEPQFRFVIVAKTKKAIEIKPEAARELLVQQQLSTVIVNDRFTLFGDYEYMKHVINDPAADGELKKQVARIGDSAIAWAVLVTAPIKKEVEELAQRSDEKFRAKFEAVMTKTTMLAARVDLANRSVPVVLETASEADAIEVEKVLNEFNKEISRSELERAQLAAARAPKRVGDALIKFAERFSKDYQQSIVFTRKGARITSKLDQQYYEASQMGTYIPMICAAIDAMNSR